MAPITIPLTSTDTAVLARVRGEVAAAMRTVAAAEKDLRVVGRLYEIAAMVAQELSHAEARQAMAQAPVTGLPRPSLQERLKPQPPKPSASGPSVSVPASGKPVGG